MKKSSDDRDKPRKKNFTAFGYCRLWRGFQDDPLYKKKRKFSQWEAWEYLYMSARGVDTVLPFHGRIVRLNRGQVVTSQHDLARRWRWTRGSVRNFLGKLERRGAISNKGILGAGGFSIITLLKYEELNPQ